MNILRSFKNGLLLGTTMSGTGDVGDGAGGGDAPPGAAGGFSASLPEDLRSHDAFKDVKDAGDLARRYADTQKPFALPEKYTKDNPALKDIKSLDALADAYTNQSKLLGADKARIALMPKDDNDKAGWDAFYKTQGRPETADKYALPEKRPDGSAYSDGDKAFQKSVLPILHQAGLTQRQISAITPQWDTLVAGMTKAHDDALIAGQKTAADGLRTEWGGEYDAKVGLAIDAIKHYSAELKLGDAVVKELDGTTIGNNPALAKMLSYMGAQLKEDGLLGKHAGGMGDGLSVDAAKTQIAEKEKAFRDNKSFADKKAPGRDDALAEIKRLYEIAYPEQKPPGA